MTTPSLETPWMKARSIALGFLCVMALPAALALADVRAPELATVDAVAVERVSPVHMANAALDVGPGSDEALLAALPR